MSRYSKWDYFVDAFIRVVPLLFILWVIGMTVAVSVLITLYIRA